jgi:hypothetical protein
MEAWVAKMADADARFPGVDGPVHRGHAAAMLTQLNAISLLPSSDIQYPLITVTTHHVKPGSDAALRTAITKVNAALDAGKFPRAQSGHVLTSGGPAPPTPSSHHERAGRKAPSPSLIEVLEKQLGKPAADALVKSFFDNVVSANTELLRLRTDLSYLPK